MSKTKPNYFDNSPPLEVINKNNKSALYSISIVFIILFLFFVLLNPIGGSIIPGVIISIIGPLPLLLSHFLGYKYHPNTVGFTNQGIYLKRDIGNDKFIPWKKITRVSEDGKQVYYPALYYFGGEAFQALFSEARLNVWSYWGKYQEYKRNNPQYKLKEIVEKLKIRKKQIYMIGFILIISMIADIWFFLFESIFELLIVLLLGTSFLIVALIYFIYQHKELKEDILELEKQLRS